MTDDLEQRLDRLAAELTATATVPPPSAVWRRGWRRRRRQLALATVLAVAVAGLAAGPGAGLLERSDPPATVAGPPTTVTVAVLQPPQVAERQFAVVIQDPPPGFPKRLRGRMLSRNCGKVDTGTHLYRFMVIAEARYRGKLLVFNVLPWPATKEPPVKPRNFQAPWVSASRLRLDGEDDGAPDMIAERPQTLLKLDRADGTKGSIVGAYRVVRSVSTGTTPAVATVRGITRAQLAMSWNCTGTP